MDSWKLEFLPTAIKDLTRIDSETRQRCISKLDWFLKNFDTLTPLALTGEFSEFFKLRVGDIRVFYKILWDQRRILICYIQRRDKAYKKAKK